MAISSPSLVENIIVYKAVKSCYHWRLWFTRCGEKEIFYSIVAFISPMILSSKRIISLILWACHPCQASDASAIYCFLSSLLKMLILLIHANWALQLLSISLLFLDEWALHSEPLFGRLYGLLLLTF